MEGQMKRTNRVAGFTLIELAMVLFIIGLLLVGLLSPLAVKVEQEERGKTQASLDEIHAALIGFALGNRRLPCPDTDGDGVENPAAPAANCTSDAGILPWVTLGVEQMDAWGNPFLYRVTDNFADALVAGENATFSLTDDGDITILDADGGNIVASNIPAVVLSHGKNRPLAADASTDEEENYEDASNANDTPGTIVNRIYDNTFDDMVIWISPNVLRVKMVEAGLLP